MGSERIPQRPHEVLELKYPIREGGEKGSVELTTVYVKRPRAKEMRLVPANWGGPGSTVGDIYPFAQALAGLLPSEFEQLDHEDLHALMAVVGGFIEAFPPPGPST